MNYRHIYHAGNCADVVKHSVMILLLEALTKKEKGFCYIDTHAGRGEYDLSSLESNKTEEYKQGIAQVKGRSSHPSLLTYSGMIDQLNGNGGLRWYPGSPWIARALLRPQDRMILNELHPNDYEELRALFLRDDRVVTHHRDAYEFLPAILPPTLRRGLVLIDPPFEKKDELLRIQNLLDKSFQKWPQGIYMVWLPLKEASLKPFYEHINRYPCERKFILEFSWDAPAEKSQALQGSAITILNLPWALEEKIKTLMQVLCELWPNINPSYTCRMS